ncbi:unnamed protein product [Mesocestoides corti]|uniref:RING-type domain-containing protein n=1 Tax=Mesocestoides corti TaxID=53468 RepID=A0A158QS74_MESCO|nr:unnamed protein product [Mesocestoides corti]
MDDKSTSSPVSFPDLGDELMLLKSAFPTELTINSRFGFFIFRNVVFVSDQGLLLTVQITPGVSNVPVNVLFALKIFCPLKYPSVSPVVTISDPVGLSDSALSDLQSDIAAIIESHETELVIFPLIECCRDFISGNIPSVDCSICFDAFQTESDVYRSRCNHFFHKACISAYHDSFRNAHNHEMALLLAKNPHCPKEMRPKGAFFLISILILVVLLGLRFKYWREGELRLNKAGGPLLTSSDVVVATLKDPQAVDLPIPFFSICNANPAKGSVLFGMHSAKQKSPTWYETFLDAHLAHPLSKTPDTAKQTSNFYHMLNHTAHDVKNMLLECRISSRSCSYAQFVKTILPSGVCYTFRGDMKPSETLHLELDPESLDYLIPNKGLVGFRFLVHDTPEPNWVHHQSAIFLGIQFHTMLRLTGIRKFAASIQLWAFLREANRRVFHELVSLDKTLLSLYQISGVMQRVVKLIGDATTYSRRGGTRIIKNLFETKEKSGRFFDENCLDQAEHNGMLARVSQLSSAFTNQLQESFLFKPDKRNVQLNLVLIFLQRSPLDFTRLLNELRISDLISDVTVLDLRRNGQKCLDSAYSLNGLLSNFTTTYHFPLNSSEARANGAARANENIISSLQAMLLATDASLTKLSAEFSRLYNQNKLLINEMRSLLSYQSSVERRHCRVSVTVQLTSRQGQSLLLKSSESLMSKDAELLDILTSAVMIGSLVVLLAEGAFSAVWRCRLSPHSRASGDLKRRFTTPEFDRSRPPPPAPQSAHQDHSTGMPRLQRGSGRNVYGLPRDSVTPACTVKWNHFTLAPPHKFVGQIARHQQQHQRQLFLDITETSSGVINSPSTSAHPFSDVV